MNGSSISSTLATGAAFSFLAATGAPPAAGTALLADLSPFLAARAASFCAFLSDDLDGGSLLLLLLLLSEGGATGAAEAAGVGAVIVRKRWRGGGIGL